MRAIEDAARAAGYAVLLCNADDDPDREAGYLDLLVERRVDGVVIAASSLGAHHREWLASPPLPVVLVNTVAEGVALPAIVSDNLAGGRLAVEHLFELGHRRIGHLTAPRNPDSGDRLAGAREAFSTARRSARDLVVARGEPGVAGGEGAMRELLAGTPDLTAVFAYNDLMAIGAMRAIKASGRRVPQDVSVIGFDDVALAAFVDPPLTTMAQSTAELGRWAFDRLSRSLSTWRGPGGPGTASPEDLVRLPVRLEIRQSTARASASSWTSTDDRSRR